MWNRLIQYFEGRKFAPVELHTEGMRLFYIKEEQAVSMVWLIAGDVCEKLTREQYENYCTTIQDVFFKQNFKYVQMLTLFFSSDIASMKQLAEGHMYWVIDERYGRLIVFENQPEDFLGLRKMLENNLSFGGDSRNSGGAQNNAFRNNYAKAQTEKKFGKRPRGYAGGLAPQKQLYRKINKYSFVTIAIIIVNILVFLLTDLFQVNRLIEGGAVSWQAVLNNHEFYRVLSCMFLHGDIGHISSNMLVLFAVGDTMEKDLGHVRYAVLYFLAGIAASIASVMIHYWSGQYTWSIGASGAVYGVAGAMVMMFVMNPYLRRQENLIRMGIFVVFLFYSLLTGEQGIDNAAHLGGFIFGGALYFVMQQIRPVWRNRKPRKYRR